MEIQRRKTKKIYIGSVPIDANAHLTVQSLNKSSTS
ncbi:hypothetical protein HKBW3S42_01465, partial [Candidatus Hakubella thermalkaliphila]